MEVVFLGTGGGRFNLISQERRTGGFRINGSLAIHVDPGPGALAASIAYGQDARKLDLLVITHNHIDHTNDAGLLAEAMTNYSRTKKGMLIGSKSAVEGDENGDRGISFYHLSKLARVEAAKIGQPIAIPLCAGASRSASLVPAPVRHEDKTGFGFVLEMDGKRIGYTSDTEYFEGMPRHYSNCDLLIANNLKPDKDGIPGYLDSGSTARLLSEAKPKLAILTHMGTTLLRADPEKEAEKIERKSGVKTIAAKDGMKIEL